MAKPAKELTIHDLSGFKQLRRVATLLWALTGIGLAAVPRVEQVV